MKASSELPGIDEDLYELLVVVHRGRDHGIVVIPLPLDYLPIAVLVSEATQKIFEYLVLGRDSLQNFGMLSCRVNSLHVICRNEPATILVKFIESLINYGLSSWVKGASNC